MVKLRGQIVVETEKSIEFHITEDQCCRLDGQTEWFAIDIHTLNDFFVFSIQRPTTILDPTISPG